VEQKWEWGVTASEVMALVKTKESKILEQNKKSQSSETIAMQRVTRTQHVKASENKSDKKTPINKQRELQIISGEKSCAPRSS